MWSDSSPGTFCKGSGSTHEILDGYGVVPFATVDGEKYSWPVVQVLTTSQFDGRDEDGACSVQTFMKIILAHETAHTLGLPDMYSVSGHDNGQVSCLMSHFDSVAVDTLCSLIQENGGNAFCTYCYNQLQTFIPDDAYES